MMKATPKFDKEFEKWVIDIETEDGEIIPVGKTINDKIGLFEISKWDTKEQAEEWVQAKSKILILKY
ncbi:hypothetical protein AL714_13310 [Clostridium botulinum]|uniref:hypothetical protein n=1 Tax=Clostridium botulinum TaxID=1491 RepID=UPI00099B366F|nr:hypothetical protein [Clostridium botulinum]MCC5441011.1 hypothetical protein [Clostridium botulinum]NFA98580.1 hypothetical protein [Clostridium botulinum]NFF11914.1 hypothetical protein [Clostridium botulinum]NFJ83928.1 hypothetical protein [Clostridium botulinum]NFR59050.1 hypothetical protein [Clostridium botulinum]